MTKTCIVCGDEIEDQWQNCEPCPCARPRFSSRHKFLPETVEQKILKAGGTIIGAPLTNPSGELNPECTDQLLKLLA